MLQLLVQLFLFIPPLLALLLLVERPFSLLLLPPLFPLLQESLPMVGIGPFDARAAILGATGVVGGDGAAAPGLIGEGPAVEAPAPASALLGPLVGGGIAVGGFAIGGGVLFPFELPPWVVRLVEVHLLRWRSQARLALVQLSNLFFPSIHRFHLNPARSGSQSDAAVFAVNLRACPQLAAANSQDALLAVLEHIDPSARFSLGNMLLGNQLYLDVLAKVESRYATDRYSNWVMLGTDHSPAMLASNPPGKVFSNGLLRIPGCERVANVFHNWLITQDQNAPNLDETRFLTVQLELVRTPALYHVEYSLENSTS